MKLVINEWLWSDLSGENGEDRQKESFKFLEVIFCRCDQMVMVEGSPFNRKFWNLANAAGTGDLRRGIVRFFKVSFLYNPEKVKLVKEENMPALSGEITGQIKNDDQYLVRAYRASKADVLVTTDEPLIATLKGHGIDCRARSDFVKEYISERGHQ